jgi:addiction module HigA family antidote
MAKTTIRLPGAVLKGLLDSYHISVAKISEDISLSPSTIRQLINNNLKISTVIAFKLAKYFDKKPEYWINLQTNYEVSQFQQDASVTAMLKAIPKAAKLPAPKPARPTAAKETKARAAVKPASGKGAKARAAVKPAAGRGAKARADAVPATVRKPRTAKAKPAAD